VYEVGSDVQKRDNALVYSDENCEIIYNLWGERGTMDFVLTNKTTEDIYVNMAKSFFIINGLAHDYYTDREYTKSVLSQESSSVGLTNSFYGSVSKSASAAAYREGIWNPLVSVSLSKSVTAGVGTSKSSNVVKSVGQSSSVTTREEREILVPAGASKIIRSFGISDYVYLECDNDEFNMPKKESEKIVYGADKSPLQFKNRIVYSLNGKENRVVNSFWVESVQNITESRMTESVYEKDCITKIKETTKYLKNGGPNKFYNTYELQPQ
jgi:hypothetical protein